MGDNLGGALARLPPGAGVGVRHYSLAPAARRALFERIEQVALRRRLMLVAGGIDHGRHRGALTAPVHSRREAVAAARNGARLLFVSPVHGTRSHPGVRPLGLARLGLMIRDVKVPVIALGGMDERRWRALRPLDVHGWAAIDAWMRG